MRGTVRNRERFCPQVLPTTRNRGADCDSSHSVLRGGPSMLRRIACSHSPLSRRRPSSERPWWHRRPVPVETAVAEPPRRSSPRGSTTPGSSPSPAPGTCSWPKQARVGQVPAILAREDPTALVCFGTSGAITKISSRGHQSRIITGLPSLAGDRRRKASGPSDVAATGRSSRSLIGLGADPAIRSTLPRRPAAAGHPGRDTRGYDGLRTVADIAGWEADNNPVPPADAGQQPGRDGGRRGRYVVADAGGNTVLSVTPGVGSGR